MLVDRPRFWQQSSATCWSLHLDAPTEPPAAWVWRTELGEEAGRWRWTTDRVEGWAESAYDARIEASAALRGVGSVLAMAG